MESCDIGGICTQRPYYKPPHLFLDGCVLTMFLPKLILAWDEKEENEFKRFGSKMCKCPTNYLFALYNYIDVYMSSLGEGVDEGVYMYSYFLPLGNVNGSLCLSFAHCSILEKDYCYQF